MEIRSASYVISSPAYQDCPATDLPEYAFIGRSNVGKSSLINMLTDIDKLAKTSAAPGKTQLINHFIIDSIDEKKVVTKWWLVDLPGYGFAKVSQIHARGMNAERRSARAGVSESAGQCDLKGCRTKARAGAVLDHFAGNQVHRW